MRPCFLKAAAEKRNRFKVGSVRLPVDRVVCVLRVRCAVVCFRGRLPSCVRGCSSGRRRSSVSRSGSLAGRHRMTGAWSQSLGVSGPAVGSAIDKRVEHGRAGLRLWFARRALRAQLLLLLESGRGSGVILLWSDLLLRPLEERRLGLRSCLLSRVLLAVVVLNVSSATVGGFAVAVIYDHDVADPAWRRAIA